MKVKFLGLANLILDREITKELIQEEMTPENIVKELKSLKQARVRWLWRMILMIYYQSLARKEQVNWLPKKL